jgi:drug/metabolite transporter (DMT)-like permease
MCHLRTRETPWGYRPGLTTAFTFTYLMQTIPWRGYLLLFAGMSVVGTYVALSKPLTATIPVFLLATLRFSIAAILMVPWLRDRPLDPAQTLPADADTLSPGDVGKTLFIQSFFGNFLFSICMLWGVSLTSAASAGVILACLPAAVALLSWLWLRETLHPRLIAAVGMAVLGVVLLSLARQPDAVQATDSQLMGNALVVACVFCEAVYVILGKRLTAVMSPKRISALINLIGLVLMLPLGIWQGWSFDFTSISATMWGLLVFYALAASMLSTWLWLSGLKVVPASQSGVFTIALPLAASLVAVSFLGERFTVLHLAAFVCASLGVVLASLPARSTTAAQTRK